MYTFEFVGGFIDYEGTGVQLKVKSVDTSKLEKYGQCSITFADKHGDTITNKYDTKHEVGGWVFSTTIRNLLQGNVGQSVTMDTIEGLVGKHAKFELKRSEPNSEGKTFINIKRCDMDLTPFGDGQAEPQAENKPFDMADEDAGF